MHNRKALKPEERLLINEAYKTKYEEYNKLTLDELKELYSNPPKRIGGSHKKALFDVVSRKLQELAVLNAKTDNIAEPIKIEEITEVNKEIKE